MTSFVIPWFRKFDLLKLSLPHNAAMFTSDAEVVIAADDTHDIVPLLALVKMFQHIRFVVVANPVRHGWRPPCAAINVGIRHANGSRIVVISPETIVRLPRPDYLNSLVTDRWFYTGLCWGMQMPLDGNSLTERLSGYQNAPPLLPFGNGFIMCEKWVFEALRGLDESRTTYGRDDCDIRFRLMKFGLKMLIDPNIHACHIDHPNTERRSIGCQPIRNEAILQDQPDWGRDFGSVAWDWKTK